MNMTKKKASFAVATTAALLLAGCSSDDKMAKSMEKGSQEMGQCHGVNSCKGKSACATAESACQSHNSCKGKGWVMSNQTDCQAKGGKFMSQ